MSVELDPPELGFKRPFTTEVSQVLRIRNKESEPIAFKVKTTAPKQYCVRPNSGRIDPGEQVEVQVLLQAMKEDPPPDAKCRDKFLVQSVAITGEKVDFSNIPSVWSHIEQTNKSAIVEKKIRVLFLAADDNSSAPAAADTPSKSTGAGFADSPSAYHGSPEAVTPHGSGAAAVGTATSIDSKPANSRSAGEAASSAFNPATKQEGSTGLSIPTSMEDVKAQLSEANATIQRLRQQAEEQGVLRRRNDGSGSKSASGSETVAAQVQQAAGGVPVQIVAALCLICFLLAYFFF